MNCDNCDRLINAVGAIRVGMFAYCEDCAPDPDVEMLGRGYAVDDDVQDDES